MSKKLIVLLSVLMVVSMVLGACAQPTPQIVEKEVVKEVQVEVTKEVVKEVEKKVEVQVTVAAPEVKPNPYRPENIIKLVDELKAATAGKPAPAGAKYVLLTNAVAPFWTAAQIGAARASSEVNVPITFQAPTASEKLAQQLSMLETFVNDKYTAITFSAIDRKAAASIVDKAVGEGINVLCTDSDATGTKRAMYIGMSDYDAGKSAGEAAKEIIGKGKVVGLVGYATAQNAQDRIQGVKDSFKGSELELVEVLLDDVKPEVSLSNAETAMQKYPDLAGFITFYSYNGPTAAQAVKQAGAQGKVKIVAFDAEPETMRAMTEGVVQAMIGQRVYFYGYLSGYIMHALSTIGKEETMKILDPYLAEWPSTDIKDATSGEVTFAKGSEGKIHLNTGVDVIKAETFDLYKEYLNSIGIASQ